MEDATWRQVQALCPESSEYSDNTEVPTNSTSIPSSEAGKASRGEEPSGVADTTLEEVPIHGGKTTNTAPRLEAVNTVEAALTNKGMIAEHQE